VIPGVDSLSLSAVVLVVMVPWVHFELKEAFVFELFFLTSGLGLIDNVIIVIVQSTK
jgi:hypothetical protein